NPKIPFSKMYAITCGGASDALDAMNAGDVLRAKALLQAALQQAEELYLSAEEAADSPDENFNP
ncbi:MAG: hypothetical protein RRY97_01110, partial [Oscillibacter sp.]